MSGQKPVFPPKNVPHLVEALAGYGRQVIVDAGHGVTEFNQPLLERVDQVVVCIRPERLALASSKRLIAYLKEIMLPTAILHAVLLDFGQSIAPPQSALEQYIGHKLLDSIRIKRQHMVQEANGGQALVIANPKSPLPKSFARLSKKLLTAESSF